jgi:hypothetical protein
VQRLVRQLRAHFVWSPTAATWESLINALVIARRFIVEHHEDSLLQVPPGAGQPSDIPVKWFCMRGR